MIIQTLHGFAILDLIFGLVTLCFVVSNITGDSCANLIADYWAKFGKSTNAKANGHAPAKGAGKRSLITLECAAVRLALDRLC